MASKENKVWEVDVWFTVSAPNDEEAVLTLKKRLSGFGLFENIDYKVYDRAAYEVEDEGGI